ncbi:ABC transporter permease [Listeria sp. FSL L7-1582]|uniref:ABC transporter permease n=1 Tax=Listeria portnoyi TaxID=2713504 RepID=UPI00164E6402|nr:ABC transporter permease [Listeria portnoyi]MBC6308480.1 ABC transporter permease [Listeria portnoyi]
MEFNIKNYVKLNFLESLKKGYLLIGLIIALTPAIIICYSILKLGTPFYIKHVSNFYCMLGMLVAVIHPLYFISRDYNSKTILLVNNTRKNREKYVIANLILTTIYIVIYIIIGIALLLIASQMGIPGDLDVFFLSDFAINIFLLVLTYYLCSYVLIIYGLKSGAVYLILTAMLLFIPNFLANIIEGVTDKSLRFIIENFPGYYYPVMVASNSLTAMQYVISSVLLLLLLMLVFKKSKYIEI